MDRSQYARAVAGAAAFVLAGLPAVGAASNTETTASIVAQAKRGTIDVYRSPGARRPFLRLRSPNPDGSPLVFLVKNRATGWEQVFLPRRPNGSVGWIPDSSLNLSLDPFEVWVSLRSHRITVFEGSKVVDNERAGVGRSVLPTPRGTYYLVELLKQPNPHGAYGPYAFALSAFSNVLQSFGGGPGEIGLHGTNEPWALGTDVSHGCIRISNSGITKLASLLPLGTPVQITN